MTPREMFRFNVIRWTAGAVGVALVVLVATLVTAFRSTEVEAAAPPPTVETSALKLPVLGEPTDVAEAVSRDLFNPERRKPAKRYRPPGSPDAGGTRAPAARPIVIGTALGADGEHFATCQVGDTPAVIVRPGQKVGEYTVLSIVRGKVTFRGPGGETIAIDANKPAP